MKALLTTSETNLKFVRVQENVVLTEPVLKAADARLKTSEVVSWWFDKGGVKLHVIGIFVIADAVATDKLK